MRWKELLIGALVTLVITIVAGVVIFYVTVPRPTKGEKLVYAVEEPFKYESAKTTDSFQTVKVANIGGQAAHDVALVLSFGDGLKIVDHALSPSDAAEVQDLSTDKRIVVHIATLLPREQFAVSVMLSGSLNRSVTVNLRSDAMIGYPAAIGASAVTPDTQKNRVAMYLLPILLLFQIGVGLALRRPLSKLLRRQTPFQRSLNNTAFLYLHTGLRDDAERLLQKGIWRNGGDSYMLANYALALALSGQMDQVESHIAAANICAEEKHERAVVCFNRALILYHTGHATEGETQMREAVKLSTEIKRYLGFSSVVSELRAKTPNFDRYLVGMSVASS